jgi:anti-sigma-K factor RskA
MDDKTKRIEDLIRIYGADMDRWPAAEGLGRPQLDARLKAVHAEEEALDDLIQRSAVPAPSAALRARILAIPGTAPRAARGFSWILTGFWRPAGVAACALILGLFLGQLTLVQTAQVTQVGSADSETETLFADLVLGPADGLTEFPQ